MAKSRRDLMPGSHFSDLAVIVYFTGDKTSTACNSWYRHRYTRHAFLDIENDYQNNLGDQADHV